MTIWDELVAWYNPAPGNTCEYCGEDILPLLGCGCSPAYWEGAEESVAEGAVSAAYRRWCVEAPVYRRTNAIEARMRDAFTARTGRPGWEIPGWPDYGGLRYRALGLRLARIRAIDRGKRLSAPVGDLIEIR